MSEKYTITLNKTQLKIIQKALEWFFRLQMGQFFDYADEIALNGEDVFNHNDPDHERKFNEYIWRRNDAKEAFEKAFRIAQPKLFCQKTEDMMIAEDMWRVIRHKFWLDRPEPKSHITVDSDEPIFFACEPPIKVKGDQDP